MKTLNIHLHLMYHLGVRIIREWQKSQSANSSIVNDADVVRARQFLSAMRSHIAVVGLPGKLDLPESDPRQYELRDLPELTDMENQTFAHLCVLMQTLLVELAESQSSRNSSGLSAPDRARVLALVAEMETFLNAALQIQPLDLPESSPRAPLQGEGSRGLGNGN